MTDVRIDRNLFMVVPIERDGSIWGYIHSKPIMRAAFESNFDSIAKAFTLLYTGGYGWTSGPRIAAFLLQQAAEGLGKWDRTDLGLPDVKNGLFAEIRRRSDLVFQGEGGWQQIAYQTAIDGKKLDEDEISEVENAIVFFTLVSSMHKKVERATILNGALPLWNARVESSSCSEFVNSLKTSTEVASSGETSPQAASFQLR